MPPGQSQWYARRLMPLLVFPCGIFDWFYGVRVCQAVHALRISIMLELVWHPASPAAAMRGRTCFPGRVSRTSGFLVNANILPPGCLTRAFFLCTSDANEIAAFSICCQYNLTPAVFFSFAQFYHENWGLSAYRTISSIRLDMFTVRAKVKCSDNLCMYATWVYQNIMSSCCCCCHFGNYVVVSSCRWSIVKVLTSI